MSSKCPIKVLQIVGSMHPGGMENFIMNLYEHINPELVHFDFVVHMKRPGDYCDKIEEMGGTIYELPRLTSHPVKNLKSLKSIVKEGNYNIVVRHTANALITPQLIACKIAGAKTVCHSHNTTDPRKGLHYLCRTLMKASTDIRLACSAQAGKWMYSNLDYTVIHNAIDLDRFAYNGAASDEIRREFNCEGKHVYGHIANFIDSKNHMYLLEIFRKLVDIDPLAICFCLGDGLNRPKIEQRIKELNLENHVVLAGVRRDVPEFMSAMDVLIFPSIFEGLPLTLIEAQASGLPILMSDTITDDVIVTEGLIEKKSISASPMDWAERALQLSSSKGPRTLQKETITKNGYEINALTGWYEKFFIDLAD